jgi:hypothetical protein
VVLTSGDKHKKDVTITDFRPMDLEDNYISETPHKILYLCPKYLNDETPKVYREWLMAIEDSMEKEMNRDDYGKEVIQDRADKKSIYKNQRGVIEHIKRVRCYC